MTALGRLALVCAIVALAGCASRPAGAPVASVLAGPALAAAVARVEAREAFLAEAGSLGFSGRVAMSNGREGGSGRIDWWQGGSSYQVQLRAPVTRQGWSLSAGPGRARIDGLEGGPRHGADAQVLLLEATGMQVPLGALAAWAAGTRADPAAHGPAQLEFSAAGELVRLHQAGWTIDYTAWETVQEGSAKPAMPQRINAARGQDRVRLVVDAWAPGAPAPGDP